MLHILVPVYNEKDQLQDVLNHLKTVLNQMKLPFEIVIVDDGSDDGSAEIVRSKQEELPIVLLQHKTNKGVSSAFRTGFDYITKKMADDDLILTMEANRNADPKTIPALMEKINQGADLAIASCYAPGGKVVGDPPLRLILSKGINLILRVFFPCGGIHTYTSFYRLWSAKIIKKLKTETNGKYFDCEGFVCMADMLIKASKYNSIRISEVPFILISDIKQSGSKMKILKTILGYSQLFKVNLFRKKLDLE